MGALEARGVRIEDNGASAEAEGFNEVVERVIVLTRIHVRYRLRLASDADRARVDRALETHVSKCPTAESLRGAVQVTWEADITGAEAAPA